MTTDNFYSYEDLKEVISYTSKKHENLRTVLKELSHNNKCVYTDWQPNDNYILKKNCPRNYNCEELKKSFIYNICKEKGDYTHYHCSCSEAILYPTSFINKYNYKEILIGSRCFRKFGDKATKIMDEFEGKKKCPSCNRTVSKQVVERYKHEENIYHMKCYKGQNYREETINELPPPYEEPIVTASTIVTLGKHKYKTVFELTQDEGYVEWIISLENPSGQLKDIRDFLLNQ
jgi:hypothetical protein